MNAGETDPRIYDALALPNEAIANGGIEILRAGLIDEELYVTARRAFADVAVWGEVLADIARRLALIHSAEGEYSEAEALAAIESAFAADLGATAVKSSPRKPARKPAAKAKRKPAAKPVRKSASKTARKPIRSKSAPGRGRKGR